MCTIKELSKAIVIIPTTGVDSVVKALESVKNQTIKTDIYLVCDGQEYHSKLQSLVYDKYYGNVYYVNLPINVGANGWYGHRVYSSFPFLVNNDYILFLDQDVYYDPDHVESMINLIETKKLDWCYSLRKIIDKDGSFVCNDDSESLGKHLNAYIDLHIDTNCFCLKKEVAIKSCFAFYGKWGADRQFYNLLRNMFQHYDCTGKYTVNYTLEGNPGSPTKDFFLRGNERMELKYGKDYYNKWRK